MTPAVALSTQCEREAAYFRRLVMTGELSYYMPPNPTQDERVLDMTMAAVALADWEMEAELLAGVRTFSARNVVGLGKMVSSGSAASEPRDASCQRIALNRSTT